MKQRHLVVIAVLASAALAPLAACGGSKHPAPAAPTHAAGPVGTLRDLQNGDRACYVVVDTDAGQQSIEGDFALCAGGDHDATALIGKRVTWTTTKQSVLAAECEGDESCGKSDEVDMIDSITAAP
ncbi:MAG TPA: hypothetical protein VHE35_16535 [Kofleriaceae bacterium]|nr:hypothetical protein [Kofleriaceae bacterium]